MYGIRSFLSAGAFLGLALVNVKAQENPDKPLPPGSASSALEADSTGSGSAPAAAAVPGYPDCDVVVPGWVGDGWCDGAYGNYNTEACGYDGGDCCECDCDDDALYDCGIAGYDCRDPSSSCALLCNSIGCPPGTTPIPEAWETPCDGDECTVEQCCEAFCSYVACPPNYTPVEDAADIKCSDEVDGCTTDLCCDGGECGVSYGPCEDGLECCDDTFVCYDAAGDGEPECVPISSIDPGDCASLWGQCGGIEYDGPTCCGPFAECVDSNEYYSQCLPNP